MSLSSIVETLQNKKLSVDEIKSLNEFQNTFKIDDDDPLIVVLALMARSQLIIESVPNLLQQKVNETIELHKMVLRDQAVLISKELISDLSVHIEATNANWRKVWLRYFVFFAGGVLFAAGVFFMSRYWVR